MPEPAKEKTRIDYVQRLVQVVAYLRAIEALWWIGTHIGSDNGKTATSPLDRTLAAVIHVVRILTSFGD